MQLCEVIVVTASVIRSERVVGAHVAVAVGLLVVDGGLIFGYMIVGCSAEIGATVSR